MAIFLGYARVLSGTAAAQVSTAAGLPAPGSGRWSLALRRSALTVAASGSLHGTVTEARATPEQVRLTVDVDALGLVDAVAPLANEPAAPAPAVGAEVSLSVDPTRLAMIQTSLD